MSFFELTVGAKRISVFKDSFVAMLLLGFSLVIWKLSAESQTPGLSI